MKMRIVLALLAFVAQSQGDEPPVVTRPSTPAEMAAARARVESYYKSLPLSQQPVRYIEVEGRLVPAQIEPNQGVEYRWKNVVLQPSQVPHFLEDGSYGILPMKPTGLPVQQLDPPIRYFPLRESSRFGVGYYDSHNAILYQWEGVVLNQADLPQDAKDQGLIIDSSSVTLSSVAPPEEKSSGILKSEPRVPLSPAIAATPASLPTPTAEPKIKSQPIPTNGATPTAIKPPERTDTPASTLGERIPVWVWLLGVIALTVVLTAVRRKNKKRQ